MIFFSEPLSDAEFSLLNDITSLQYGEIYDIELEDGEKEKLVKMTRPQKALVDLIRSGVQSFETIKVHQAEPAYAEVMMSTSSGRFRCKKLYKFN